MADLATLKARLDGAVRGLAGVVEKRLFGCDGYFAGAGIFAMVWKEGRLAVRLPDAEAFDELMAARGASPWTPGGKMTVKHWVLLPPAIERDDAKLAGWVARAHGLTGKATSAPKKTAAKKAAAKKTAAKKKT